MRSEKLTNILRVTILFIFHCSFLIAHSLHAQYFNSPPLVLYRSNVPEIISRSAVLIDAETGTLIFYKNPDEKIPPASLTKLMTMHLLMKEIEEGRASYDDLVTVTEEAWYKNQPPLSSLMFLAPGQIVSLREIMLGLAVSSGNDAAMAAALHLAPSMEEFARIMSEEARRMGLIVTSFAEPSGISEQNITTAQEFAFFCRRYLELHPNSLKDFHSAESFSYPLAANTGKSEFRETVTQNNRNTLLGKFHGVDGLKTGYIEESGYNFAVTAQRDNTRFIAVILGAPSVPQGRYIRDSDAQTLIEWAFKNYKTVHLKNINIEKARLWKGREKIVELKLAYSADFTSPVNRANVLYYKTEIRSPLTAPLTAGEEIGNLIISDNYGELNRVPIVTEREYKKGNILKQLWHTILLLFK